MIVGVKSDCYLGCDYQTQVSFTVKPADSPELTMYELHEEDHELLKELHGEIVGDEDSSDSDSDSDDDDAPSAKKETKDDSDDEDDEDEESSDDDSTSSEEE